MPQEVVLSLKARITGQNLAFTPDLLDSNSENFKSTSKMFCAEVIIHIRGCSKFIILKLTGSSLFFCKLFFFTGRAFVVYHNFFL